MKIFSKWIILLLSVALIFRICISLYSFQFRENTDVLRYRDWTRIEFLHGFKSTYNKSYLSFGTLPNNQPPGSLYIISIAYRVNIQAAKLILKTFGHTQEIINLTNGPLLNFSLRVPSMAADLAIGYLIYLIVRKTKKEKTAILASAIFLFNPAILYNGSFIGQMDSLNNLFFLLGIFFLLRKNYFPSVLSILLSLFIKVSLLPLLPFYLLFLYFKQKDLLQLIRNIFLALCVILLLTFPISNNPLQWLLNFFIKNGRGEISSITVFAFNFWWVLCRPYIKMGNPSNLFNFSLISLNGSPQSSLIFLGISLFNWAIILFLILSGFFSVLLLKKPKTGKKIFLLFSVIALLNFLFLPMMHERYLYPLFPLLAVCCSLNKKYISVFIILSLGNFLNLYAVWHPFLIPVLYKLIPNFYFQWLTALVIFITGLYFLALVKSEKDFS